MASSTATIHISGLPSAVTYELLQSLCIPYGPISNIHIPVDPVSRALRTYAFVTYTDPEDATQARLNLHRAEFHQKILRVVTAASRYNPVSTTKVDFVDQT